MMRSYPARCGRIPRGPAHRATGTGGPCRHEAQLRAVHEVLNAHCERIRYVYLK